MGEYVDEASHLEKVRHSDYPQPDTTHAVRTYLSNMTSPISGIDVNYQAIADGIYAKFEQHSDATKKDLLVHTMLNRPEVRSVASEMKIVDSLYDPQRMLPLIPGNAEAHINQHYLHRMHIVLAAGSSKVTPAISTFLKQRMGALASKNTIGIDCMTVDEAVKNIVAAALVWIALDEIKLPPRSQFDQTNMAGVKAFFVSYFNDVFMNPLFGPSVGVEGDIACPCHTHPSIGKADV